MKDAAVAADQPGRSPTTASRRGQRRVVVAAQKGSEVALDQLARLLWPRAYAAAAAMLGTSHLASDVAQESVLKALRALDRFDSSRPIEPWISRIATNAALDLLRSERRHAHSELTPADLPAPEDAELEGLIDSLRSLEPEARAMIVLRHLGGFSSREIGRILDTKPATVRSMMSRGLAKLRADREGGA